MVVKIHGFFISTCTRRVAVIAKERNVPYELVAVDIPGGEHQRPPHVEHHPFGQIPYMVRRRLPSSKPPTPSPPKGGG
jgi:glutathione S-transferase